MKIEHAGKNYILDPKRAIELGVLKPATKEPEIGDVYTYGAITLILVQENYHSERFFLLGNLDGNLTHYSDEPRNVQETKDFLANGEWIYKGNINNKFKALVAEFTK